MHLCGQLVDVCKQEQKKTEQSLFKSVVRPVIAGQLFWPRASEQHKQLFFPKVLFQGPVGRLCRTQSSYQVDGWKGCNSGVRDTRIFVILLKSKGHVNLSSDLWCALININLYFFHYGLTDFVYIQGKSDGSNHMKMKD